MSSSIEIRVFCKENRVFCKEIRMFSIEIRVFSKEIRVFSIENGQKLKFGHFLQNLDEIL